MSNKLKHPNLTKGSLSVTRSETAWRYRRQALKASRRQGRALIRAELNSQSETIVTDR